MYSGTLSPLSAKDNHPKQTNEDHLWCKGPRKTIKACQGKGRGLSSWESGRAVPFPPQDFCSPCVCVYSSHNSRSCGPGSAPCRAPFFFSLWSILNIGIFPTIFPFVPNFASHPFPQNTHTASPCANSWDRAVAGEREASDPSRNPSLQPISPALLPLSQSRLASCMPLLVSLSAWGESLSLVFLRCGRISF